MQVPPLSPVELDGSERVRVLKDGRLYLATVDQIAARYPTTGLAAIERRLAALEARPEEVVPLSGSITTGPLAIGTKTFLVTRLAGLKAGERVLVEASGAMPPGASVAGARVPADGTVEVTLAAVLALTASKTIPLTITALR
ncbi:hypothetical protein [Methylobacterium sp. CCH5-D2]|uniref:hypothetical protein n=1 Tax=Methylobacterium sp. CCH5-D2 TaxID=1768765 RepID=UPI000833AC63|nr:hypothetical protein [Methylobacterium sp. CCH5-D2]